MSKTLLHSKENPSDFLGNYIKLVSSYTEAKNLIHLWSILTACSAIIGRRKYFPFGTSNIYPNLYVMVVGATGTRKSTAIKEAQKYSQSSGYTDFAFESGSKAGFFDHMAQKNKDIKTKVDIDDLDFNLIDGETHSFICSDEFTEFIGHSNSDFLTTLGSLWDRDRDYEHRTAKGGIVTFPKPYITVLGGMTPSHFATYFPMSSLEQGFLSRVILIPVVGVRRKLAFPPVPCEIDKAYITDHLTSLLDTPPGPLSIDPTAKEMLEEIYEIWKSPFDSRYAGYASRRFTHLLKLITIFTCVAKLDTITVSSVIQANTLLTHTELLMPDVIGEMGRGPHAVLINLILNTLKTKHDGMNIGELSNLVHRDVRSLDELNGVLNILRTAGRIISDEHGNHSVADVPIKVSPEFEKYTDFNWLATILTGN
jgi:Protein of unknown function (DUF3987)